MKTRRREERRWRAKRKEIMNSLEGGEIRGRGGGREGGGGRWKEKHNDVPQGQ